MRVEARLSKEIKALLSGACVLLVALCLVDENGCCEYNDDQKQTSLKNYKLSGLSNALYLPFLSSLSCIIMSESVRFSRTIRWSSG